MPELLIEQRCAEALARSAGRMMLRASQGGFRVDPKGANDLVTEVDRDVEQFLTGQIRKMFPDDEILGEEFGGQAHRSEKRHWLIDPIDGTLNFSHGVPLSCVSIALQDEGISQVGVIYDPHRDEIFSARRGAGAHLNGAPMSVSDQETIDDAVLVTGFRPTVPDDLTDNLSNFVAVTRRSRGVRRLGSAALDLAYVACGRMDGFWEFGLHPWDTGAGYLLVEEAGGRVGDVQDEPYSGFEESILATNGRIHDELLELLNA
ncbi:MAG: inositol monophosphatase family protein [Persicimonas sp.]